jgi:hypothetical protein
MVPGSEIRDPEKTHSGSRIQGSKRHRIPDPDPQHCLVQDWVPTFLDLKHSYLSPLKHKETQRIQVEVLPSGILALFSQRGRCRTSRLQDYRVQEYRLPSPPSIKCNVLRKNLSEDSQKIPCATLKRRGVVGNLYLYISVQTIIIDKLLKHF